MWGLNVEFCKRPPGPGLTTVTEVVPARATSEAGTLAVSLVWDLGLLENREFSGSQSWDCTNRLRYRSDCLCLQPVLRVEGFNYRQKLTEDSHWDWYYKQGHFTRCKAAQHCLLAA